jgi:hypothetical protein
MRTFSTQEEAVGGKQRHKEREERGGEREGETDELDYDPTAFVPKRPRSATQIQALVENVELVREQLKSPIHGSVSHLSSSQGMEEGEVEGRTNLNFFFSFDDYAQAIQPIYTSGPSRNG